MEFVKSEKFILPEYCVFCQEWQKNHTSYTCPDLICKLCQNKGHVKLVCPKFYQNTIETTEEPLDDKTMFIFRFHSNLKIKEEPKEDVKKDLNPYQFEKHEKVALEYIFSKEFDEIVRQSTLKCKCIKGKSLLESWGTTFLPD